jgi:hypothetical protein
MRKKKIATLEQRMGTLIKYVNDFFEREPRSSNISISLRPLDDDELDYLRQFFAEVRPKGFLGYVEFRPKREVIQ